MIFSIHAGHNPDGKIACGAIGLIKESTEARKVASELVYLLKKNGHTVIDTTCNNGTNQSDVLNKIINKCNAQNVDLNISIHFNASSGTTDTPIGTEVFTYSSTSKANIYAEKILTNICSLGFKNRGVKYSTALAFLKRTKAPSLLIEVCFVNSKADISLYNYKTAAKSIAEAFIGKIDNSNDKDVIENHNLSNQEFISYIGKLAQEDMRKSGILASLTIAQAIKESAWGKSELAQNANALFGIKMNGWNGRGYNKLTKECYDGKNYVDVTALFRAYDSWKQSVEDHSNYLCTRKLSGNVLRYRNVIGERNYKTACIEIKNAGYTTGIDYDKGLIDLIEKYNLTKYDCINNENIPSNFIPYIVIITTDKLNVRSGAGDSFNKVIKNGKVLQLNKNEKYTIVEESNGWGKLKSGAGWIYLKYTNKY